MKFHHNLDFVTIIASSPQIKMISSYQMCYKRHTRHHGVYNTGQVYIPKNGSILVLPQKLYFSSE